MTRETCATCRFWRKNHGIEPAAGFCRRAPKAWVAGAFPDWKQPIMYDDDWCGEHQPVAPAPAASDDYTRAAVRYAEAMARLHAEPVRGNDLADAIGERDRTQHKFVALYRERHDAP